jgi:hypothetical protein
MKLDIPTKGPTTVNAGYSLSPDAALHVEMQAVKSECSKSAFVNALILAHKKGMK